VLYGYGGFGLLLLFGYFVGILVWVEVGGVYVVVGLCGGGEEGEDWYCVGMLVGK